MDSLNGWVIFLSIIASFITILLAVIGVLMKYGIDTIRSDIKSIWEWIQISDKDKAKLEREMGTLVSEVKALHEELAAVKTDMRTITSRCSEIHMSGGKRWSDPIVRPLAPAEIPERRSDDVPREG
jgi:septal ring factor EnvC (AmiA/AmiB activator)